MLSKALLSLLLWSVAEGQSRTLHLDVARSEITFAIGHMGFLTVEGAFDAFDASLTLLNDAISQIQGEIQVTSIHTGEATRDETLRSSGYLDAERFPTISFSGQSTSFKSSEIQLNGLLKIKSVARELVIHCQIQQEDTIIILLNEVPISRSEFNLDFGAMDQLIGDEIKVSAKLVFLD